MRDGVDVGRIDTVRPEHTPEAMGREPRKDDHGGEVYVYRRAGQPCYVCGTPISETVDGGSQPFLVRSLPTIAIDTAGRMFTIAHSSKRKAN